MAQRLRDLRLAGGLTQMELAVELGISRAHLAKMETGEDPPGRDLLESVAKFFRVSMDYLQTGRADAPQQGRFVQDAEQLALLDLWDSIPASERLASRECCVPLPSTNPSNIPSPPLR